MGVKESIGGATGTLELGGRSRGDTGPLRRSSRPHDSGEVAGDDMVSGLGL